MLKKFQGTGVAMVTPFDSKGEVDYCGLQQLLKNVTAAGVNYLVVFGTTAETPTLTADEKQEILAFIKKHNTAKLPIVLGMGGNDTRALIESVKSADLSGIDALLSVTPYYNKPTQEGIYQHFSALAQATELPIILYNVPGRTGVNMEAETCLRLAHEFPNVVAVKEASGNLSQVSYILRDRPTDFLVLSGDDNLAVATIALGGDGVISVAANSFPEKFCPMIEAALTGDFAKAAQLQMQLLEPTDCLFREGNPAGVKTALALRGVCGATVRLPLVGVSEQLNERLRELIAGLNC